MKLEQVSLCDEQWNPHSLDNHWNEKLISETMKISANSDNSVFTEPLVLQADLKHEIDVNIISGKNFSKNVINSDIMSSEIPSSVPEVLNPTPIVNSLPSIEINTCDISKNTLVTSSNITSQPPVSNTKTVTVTKSKSKSVTKESANSRYIKFTMQKRFISMHFVQ